MIKVENAEKSFDRQKAVQGVNLQIEDGQIFGLAGTNGAGKSTLLRMMAGVLKPDAGDIIIDGESVTENEKIKREIFFLPDNAYYLPNATITSMGNYYAMFYPNFNKERLAEMAGKFKLDMNRKIQTFSKGMKRQASMLLGICAGTKYLLCDETFDGLDPVVRKAAKSIFAYEISERDFTPVIASHNLRELEDICDHVGILHEGGVLLSKDIEEMKLQIHKIQCVVHNPVLKEELLKELDVLQLENRMSLMTIVARGKREDIMKIVESKMPVFAEVIPLTLEEIFISETEVAGYDIKQLFN